MNALKNFLSVDEMRISGLIICFLIGFIYITYCVATHQTLDVTYVDLVKGIALYVAGINTVNAISYGYGSYYNSRSSNSLLSSTSTSNTITPTTSITSTNTSSIQGGDLDSRI